MFFKNLTKRLFSEEHAENCNYGMCCKHIPPPLRHAKISTAKISTDFYQVGGTIQAYQDLYNPPIARMDNEEYDYENKVKLEACNIVDYSHLGTPQNTKSKISYPVRKAVYARNSKKSAIF